MLFKGHLTLNRVIMPSSPYKSYSWTKDTKIRCKDDFLCSFEKAYIDYAIMEEREQKKKMRRNEFRIQSTEKGNKIEHT